MKTIVIVGPTASGKSDYAISLAQEIDGEIISADSRQVYRGMDIGTGKVPRDTELTTDNSQLTTDSKQIEKPSETLSVVSGKSYVSSGIRHHLLDVASPKRSYNVTHFLRDARAAIADIRRRGKVPIICGGTNFWIEALVFGAEFPEVKPDPELREMLGKLDADTLFRMLEEKDPDRAETIDPKNKVRLIRALEIVATLGKVPDNSHKSQVESHKSDDFRFIGIDLTKDVLHERIEKRLRKRLEEGMIEEVKRLHEQEGLSWKRLEGFGLEYRWCARFLQGMITREEMEAGIMKDSLYYAKRQMSSLRRLERKGVKIEWKR
ncbi:MAG: tRNA (adenosine(37)-N6)-dimethylallyltransferase MiaA [Candidatus Moranbacteria bacterium]|nr:tRNA (adenosine(37)-N6)-dimethylallyltransferase MiaA [Candidatus Moranbacteria bacterium]